MNHLNSLDGITRDIWSKISDEFNLDSILVFGSIVTEDFYEDSDIDFAVIGQDRLSLEQKLAFELQLEEILEREIDVIDLNDCSLDIFVKIQALNNGVLMYTRDQNQTLSKCEEETEHFYRMNESFFAKRRRELLL